MAEFDINDLKRRMEGALKSFNSELAGLRTGRASADLLNGVTVDAYGSMVPLSQVGNVSVPEARMLTVSVWDKGLVKAVEKAIGSAGLGLNPASDGQLIRLPIPDLTQERRVELTKVARKYAEEAKVAVRNVRRDGMDAVKKQEKDGAISKDELAGLEKEIQKVTDDFVKRVDDAAAAKEREILQV